MKISFIDKYPTLRFLKYSLLAFVIQIVLIAIFLYWIFNFDKDPGPQVWAVAWVYIWPLLVLPQGQGHSHGGELFFMPITAIFYALIYGVVMAIIRRPKS